MAKHMVVCLYCGKSFDANVEEYVKPKGNRYAHKSCYEQLQSSKTKEELDKEELEKYIKQLFGISCISQKIKKQMDTFHRNNNFTYSGMRKTLVYFFEVRGNPIEKANGGIGIIPWVYEEAHRYYLAIWEAQQKNENAAVEVISLPVREIVIEPPQRKPMKHLKKLFTFLDE